MSPSDEVAYAWQHRDEDTSQVLLHLPHGIDAERVGLQIEGHRTALAKWPTLADIEGYLYPPRLNREQSSSEATARHKASLIAQAKSIADLTGGMGIDAWALADRKGTEVDYVESNPTLCQLAEHNFGILPCEGHINVHNSSCEKWLEGSNKVYDLLYIDPSRRDDHGAKVSGIGQCTPDVVALLPQLQAHCRQLMIKASPMIDIKAAINQLQHVEEVHIVADKGECKEVIFICNSGINGEYDEGQPTVLHCTNLRNSRTDSHGFPIEAMGKAPQTMATRIGTYLYEPDAALMKGGCYAAVAQRFGVEQVGANSHLYTSDSLKDDFSGRVFRVISPVNLSRRAVKEAFPEGRAHVVCRNYLLRADALQRQLGLNEGGDAFLIATTWQGKPLGLKAEMLRSMAE